MLLYEWCVDTKPISESFEYGAGINIAQQTVKKIRKLTFITKLEYQMKGPGKTVEVGEDLLLRKNYYRGRTLTGEVGILRGIKNAQEKV